MPIAKASPQRVSRLTFLSSPAGLALGPRRTGSSPDVIAAGIQIHRLKQNDLGTSILNRQVWKRFVPNDACIHHRAGPNRRNWSIIRQSCVMKRGPRIVGEFQFVGNVPTDDKLGHAGERKSANDLIAEQQASPRPWCKGTGETLRGILLGTQCNRAAAFHILRRLPDIVHTRWRVHPPSRRLRSWRVQTPVQPAAMHRTPRRQSAQRGRASSSAS